MKNLTRYQILAMLPILLVLAGGYYFQRLVAFAIDTNPALNAIILGVMLVGVAIMHQQIWSIRRQSRMAEKFIQRVEQGENIPGVLHDPELGVSDIGLVCGHLTHISGGVGGRPVAAVEAGLRSLQGTLDSRQELSQFLIGFLIALGLLGTFVGILQTLVEIGNMIGGFAAADLKNIDKAFMGLISDLMKPLKGMGTAFSASMFGLIGSLCLGLTMVAVRRCTEEFVTALRHAINELIKERGVEDTAGSGLVRSRRRADIALLEGHPQHLSRQELEAQTQLIQKVGALEQRLDELSVAMLKQVETSVETNNLLRDNPVAARQIAEHFVGQIKVLATAATENSANVASLLPALSGVTQKLNDFSEVLLQQRELMQKTMLSSGESQNMIRNTLVSLVEKEGEVRSGMLGEITQLRKFMLEMQPVSSSVVPLLTEINSRLNEHSVTLNNQQETMRFMTQAVSQSFVGIKTGIAEMLLDAEKNRQLQAEMTKQLLSSQRATAELGNMQQSLSRIADALSSSVAISQALAEEVKGMRGAVVQDVRLEMQEVIQRNEAGRGNQARPNQHSGPDQAKS